MFQLYLVGGHTGQHELTSMKLTWYSKIANLVISYEKGEMLNKIISQMPLCIEYVYILKHWIATSNVFLFSTLRSVFIRIKILI